MNCLLCISVLLCISHMVISYPMCSRNCCKTNNCQRDCKSSECCTPSSCYSGREPARCCGSSSSSSCQEKSYCEDCCTTTVTPPPVTSSVTSIPTPCPQTPCNYTYYPPSTSGSSNSSTQINTMNNITIPTNIKIQNEINSETRLTIPVSVKVDNVNNVHIQAESRNMRTPIDVTPVPIRDNRTSSPVYVQVPVHIPIPKPYYVTVPKIQYVPMGCCQVTSPCTPYYYPGCLTSRTDCSGYCSGTQVYQGQHVCGSGCYQRSQATGSICENTGCYRRKINCSMCNANFDENYPSFMKCAGCFMPQYGPQGMARY